MEPTRQKELERSRELTEVRRKVMGWRGLSHGAKLAYLYILEVAGGVETAVCVRALNLSNLLDRSDRAGRHYLNDLELAGLIVREQTRGEDVVYIRDPRAVAKHRLILGTGSEQSELEFPDPEPYLPIDGVLAMADGGLGTGSARSAEPYLPGTTSQEAAKTAPFSPEAEAEAAKTAPFSPEGRAPPSANRVKDWTGENGAVFAAANALIVDVDIDIAHDHAQEQAQPQAQCIGRQTAAKTAPFSPVPDPAAHAKNVGYVGKAAAGGSRGIAWGKSPLAPELSPARVLSVRAGQRLRAVFLGQAQGVWTHFLEGRTRPCQSEKCQRCAAQVPRRWYGYAPALIRPCVITGRIGNDPIVDYGPVRLGIPELSPSAFGPLEGLELRGLIVELSRAKAKAPLRLAICADEVLAAVVPLPEAFDVLAILFRLWEVLP